MIAILKLCCEMNKNQFYEEKTLVRSAQFVLIWSNATKLRIVRISSTFYI